MHLTTYYDILMISPKATDTDVRRAYHAQALRWHPDRHLRDRQRAAQVFAQVHRAYLILKTQRQRDVYNRVLLKHLRAITPARKRSVLSLKRKRANG